MSKRKYVPIEPERKCWIYNKMKSLLAFSAFMTLVCFLNSDYLAASGWAFSSCLLLCEVLNGNV